MTLLTLLVVSTLGASPVPLPWGEGKTLGERVALGKTRVCTDGRSHYVAVAPDEKQLVQLFVGDGKRFVQVRKPPAALHGYLFQEPRFPNPTGNDDFRGADLRDYSRVDVDPDAGSCTVSCGPRKVSLKLLTPDESGPLLLDARFEPNPQAYAPHALLRDDGGRYYYVDRGLLSDNEKAFRFFMGPKGSLQLQKMKDVASDSEGQIFSTENGELRLVVDYVGTRRRREHLEPGEALIVISSAVPSVWIQHEKKIPLRVVPVEENLPLIYNELGVYTGARLGTPCDDL